MAYVKLASFAVFLLAAFVMFPMKKVEGAGCQQSCGTFLPGCRNDCECVPVDCTYGVCVGFCENDNVVSGNFHRKVEEHPKLCMSHDECTKKGSGNYCAHFPNSNLEYGYCFASVSEAQDAYKIASSLKFKKDFLKMSLPA
uniref:Albumin I chain a domain-containing protein n=1 Tax=Medicago truncatula TaxID=3880 RepID=I3T6D0_MEDTR|nr:unknown [Medicago truncatula]